MIDVIVGGCGFSWGNYVQALILVAGMHLP
jgi:hypothetical protein